MLYFFSCVCFPVSRLDRTIVIFSVFFLDDVQGENFSLHQRRKWWETAEDNLPVSQNYIFTSTFDDFYSGKCGSKFGSRALLQGPCFFLGRSPKVKGPRSLLWPDSDPATIFDSRWKVRHSFYDCLRAKRYVGSPGTARYPENKDVESIATTLCVWRCAVTVNFGFYGEHRLTDSANPLLGWGRSPFQLRKID